ncbi:hypothetical protein ACFL96_00895 [Thermoproteota archaeon]
MGAAIPLNSQTLRSTNKVVEGLFYNPPYKTMERGIYNSSERHAMYAYNLANATTPEFELVLSPEDRQQLARILPPDKPVDRQVLIEFVMSRMSENNKRYNAYTTMWKQKYDILRRVITLGK